MFRKISRFSPNRFVVGFIVGAMLFSGSAFAINSYVSENTPDTGYLLCANSKTKAVTFPNKLSCPSGTIALDMGASGGVAGDDGQDGATGANGAQGPFGPTGPQGPAGPRGAAVLSTGGNIYWVAISNSIDIVADGNINSSTSMVKRIMYSLNSSDIPAGYYKLEANISGLWSDSSKVGSLLDCHFQTQTNYDKKNNALRWGSATTEKQSWNGIDLNVMGDWFTSFDSTMYLVCSTSGTVKGLDFMINVVSATNAGKLP